MKILRASALRLKTAAVSAVLKWRCRSLVERAAAHLCLAYGATLNSGWHSGVATLDPFLTDRYFGCGKELAAVKTEVSIEYCVV